MEKRPVTDFLKLLAVGLLAALMLFFVIKVQDEDFHMSSHWRLFWTGHFLVFAGVFWYCRSLLRRWTSAMLIIGWILLRTVIAFELARDGTRTLSVMATLPIETYFVVSLAKLAAKSSGVRPD